MIVKICGGALLIAFVTLLIKQLKPEMTMPVTVAGAIIILIASMDLFAPQIKFINEILYTEELKGYATPLIKSLGVALIAQTASDVCRDMGENGAANKVEFAGKIEIMLLCLPMIGELLTFARSILLG